MAERITGHTELIGLMAYPIRHSSSPAMHNEAFATLGLDYAYLAFEVDNSTLEDAVKGLRALKMVGSNVSMPNKTVVGQYLDELSPAAKMAGAATAIEIQAALDGVKEMSIFNIKDKFWANGEETVKKIRENTDCVVNLYDLDDKEKLREEIADSYLFAQATGVGMKPLEGQSVVPDETFFRPDLIVTDTVYAPRETETLRLAKKAGCKTMNGLGMMLFQGDAAFHLWTGKHMPIDHMKEVLDIKYD